MHVKTKSFLFYQHYFVKISLELIWKLHPKKPAHQKLKSNTRLLKT